MDKGRIDAMQKKQITDEKLLEVMPYVLFGIATGMYIDHNNIVNRTELEQHESDLDSTLKALLIRFSPENDEQDRDEFQQLVTNTLTPAVAYFVYEHVTGMTARNNVTGEEHTVMQGQEPDWDEDYANNLAFQSMLALTVIQQYGFDDLSHMYDMEEAKVFLEKMFQANKHIFEDASNVEYKQHDLAITLARAFVNANGEHAHEAGGSENV